jgi:hypothetical protein
MAMPMIFLLIDSRIIKQSPNGPGKCSPNGLPV